MASTKPPDYKAEAERWLEQWIWGHIDQANHRDKKFPRHVEATGSLAALLERLCGEAVAKRYKAEADLDYSKGQTAHVMQNHDKLQAQLAAAQKEIERLTAQRDALGEEANIQGDRAEKAESVIEQAQEEGFRQCDGQWQMAVGFAITGMEREKVIAQVREEGRWEQREKDAETIEDHDYSDRGRAIAQAIREAKP